MGFLHSASFLVLSPFSHSHLWRRRFKKASLFWHESKGHSVFYIKNTSNKPLQAGENGGGGGCAHGLFWCWIL